MYWQIDDEEAEMGPFCFHAFGKGMPYRIDNSDYNLEFNFVSLRDKGKSTVNNVAVLDNVELPYGDTEVSGVGCKKLWDKERCAVWIHPDAIKFCVGLSVAGPTLREILEKADV